MPEIDEGGSEGALIAQGRWMGKCEIYWWRHCTQREQRMVVRKEKPGQGSSIKIEVGGTRTERLD